MDYKCHCGAVLRYYPTDKKWVCSNGHPVYTCKECEAAGKSTPLQWVQQYQRWYCYECQEYAPQTKTSQTEEIKGYTLEIPKGSRVDEFCFMCDFLEFTQNNTHVKCGLNVPRYREPAISEITIRPIGSGKGINSKCMQLSAPSDTRMMNLLEWKNHIEYRVSKQIENHEKEAAPIEMYRIEFFGGMVTAMGQGLADSGAKAAPLPVSRDSTVGGRTTVTIDRTDMTAWIHAPKPDKVSRGVGKFFGTIAGSLEDPLTTAYLRDLLKRDIESFNFEKIYAGEEPQKFWEAIERGAAQIPDGAKEESTGQPLLAGPMIEMYKFDYHLGRAYFEIYTGGRSATTTKTWSLEPLKTSRDEFQPDRRVVVVDHQNKIVWQWLGKKVKWKSGDKNLASHAEGLERYLDFIRSHIGKKLEGYSYMAIEENKEPEQFKRLFGS
jgi:hypothetical protein